VIVKIIRKCINTFLFINTFRFIIISKLPRITGRRWVHRLTSVKSLLLTQTLFPQGERAVRVTAPSKGRGF